MKLLLSLISVLGIVACSDNIKAANPNDQVRTKLINFAESGFGTVMIADFIITNNTDASIKDIKVVCDGYSETRTKIDSNRETIYKSIKPGKSIKVRGVNMGFIHSAVQSAQCRTESFIKG